MLPGGATPLSLNICGFKSWVRHQHHIQKSLSNVL
jgi:hypothetical protein